MGGAKETERVGFRMEFVGMIDRAEGKDGVLLVLGIFFRVRSMVVGEDVEDDGIDLENGE